MVADLIDSYSNNTYQYVALQEYTILPFQRCKMALFKVGSVFPPILCLSFLEWRTRRRLGLALLLSP